MLEGLLPLIDPVVRTGEIPRNEEQRTLPEGRFHRENPKNTTSCASQTAVASTDTGAAGDASENLRRLCVIQLLANLILLIQVQYDRSEVHTVRTRRGSTSSEVELSRKLRTAATVPRQHADWARRFAEVARPARELGSQPWASEEHLVGEAAVRFGWLPIHPRDRDAAASNRNRRRRRQQREACARSQGLIGCFLLA